MMIARPFPHENKARFENLVGFTAAAEGFRPALIEKDYYCSLVLDHLRAPDSGLVFKGGTCLGKVHLGFFRLSEDLDFSLHLAGENRRSLRRQAVAPYKAAVNVLPQKIPGLEIVEPLTGSNESRQYIARIDYDPVHGGGRNTIAIEISLREPLLSVPVPGFVRTLLRDPFTGDEVIPTFRVACVDFQEAMAEKFRAALTRIEPAIRDFFDIDFAVFTEKLDPDDVGFLDLVREKLSVPGTGPVDISQARQFALEKQIQPRLRPVLREKDLQEFDLRRAFELVRNLSFRPPPPVQP